MVVEVKTIAIVAAFVFACSDPPSEPVVESTQELERESTPKLTPIPKPLFDYSNPDCPIRLEHDGYWVPVASVHTESCECYHIRAKLNGEKGDCSK